MALGAAQHSSVPCSSLYQRDGPQARSVSTSGLSWLLGKWGKDASQGCRREVQVPVPKGGAITRKLLLTSGLLRVQRE